MQLKPRPQPMANNVQRQSMSARLVERRSYCMVPTGVPGTDKCCVQYCVNSVCALRFSATPSWNGSATRQLHDMNL